MAVCLINTRGLTSLCLGCLCALYIYCHCMQTMATIMQRAVLEVRYTTQYKFMLKKIQLEHFGHISGISKFPNIFWHSWANAWHQYHFKVTGINLISVVEQLNYTKITTKLVWWEAVCLVKGFWEKSFSFVNDLWQKDHDEIGKTEIRVVLRNIVTP